MSLGEGGVHSGQFAVSSQGGNIETDIHIHSHSHLRVINLTAPFACVWTVGGGSPSTRREPTQTKLQNWNFFQEKTKQGEELTRLLACN